MSEGPAASVPSPLLNLRDRRRPVFSTMPSISACAARSEVMHGIDLDCERHVGGLAFFTAKE
jgi:hypothetical protein